jgi:hypothetical protein
VETDWAKNYPSAMRRKKSLILLTVYFFSAVIFCNGQVGEEKENFALPIEFGQGFAKAENFTHYLLAFSAAPMKSLQMNKMNKWRLGVVINYFNTNPGDDWSFGVRIGYRLNKNGELGNTFNYWLYPEYSHSLNEKNFLGMGIVIALNPLELSVHPQYETQSQKLWFSSKIGINTALFFNKKQNKKSDDPFSN